jgi:predicted dehydrogenase
MRLAVHGKPRWLTPALLEWFRSRGGRIEAVLEAQSSDSMPLADRYRARWAFPDWDQLLRETQIDAAIVSGERSLGAARSAAKSGASVLVDVPFFGEGQAATGLIRSVNRRLVPFVMQALPHRFSPSVRRLREVLNSGEFGQPQGFTYTAFLAAESGIEESSLQSREDRMILIFDLIDYLLGKIESVFASEDSSGSAQTFCVSLVSGAVGGVQLFEASEFAPVSSSLSIHSDRSVASLSDNCALECKGVDLDTVDYRPNFFSGESVEVESGTQGMLQEFSAAAAARRRPVGHIGSLRPVWETVRAARRSLETRKPTKVHRVDLRN